jgi:PSP
MKEKKAGTLSPDLLAALGMPDQSNTPPPWLINMQVTLGVMELDNNNMNTPIEA